MAKAKILVVEDEPVTAADIEDILTEFGYLVTAVTSSGTEALQKAETTSPDLVLMDIRIQGKMDGIETAFELRERFNIPVVYLTAHSDDETLARAKMAEPLGYVVKPFHPNDLQASIQVALHKHQRDCEARKESERLSATLLALGEGVICIDGMGMISFLNPAAETWTGWKLADALGRHVSEVFAIIRQDDRQPASHHVIQAMRDGNLSEIPERTALISRDGPDRQISGSVAPLRDGRGQTNGAVIAFGQIRADKPSPQGTIRRPTAGQLEAGGTTIVVESQPMRELMKFSTRIAASGVSAVLIQGESGTGKDVIAKFLHFHSERRERPFVPINCAAIPDTLLESELFGFEKGAFTDARAQKRGVLELADGGTIFLDEIGDLQLHLQAKLLRVLEEQSFRRLGGMRDINVDVRVITATNKTLIDAVRDKRFREDLFYRLNVIQIAIPPLRDHRDDILPLANHFIEHYNEKFKREIEGLDPEAADLLIGYPWPGNVRELRNAIERAMVLEERSRITPRSLSLGDTAGPYGLAAQAAAAAPLQEMSLEDAERSMLVQALEKTGGNQTRAAKRLGISRDTLRYRMKKFDLK